MNISATLLMVSYISDNYTYLAVLTVASVVATALAISAWIQRKEKKLLERELSHLMATKKQEVEYELVLQAMNLATWRNDLTRKVTTYDNDYRTHPRAYAPPPNTPLEALVTLLHPDDVEMVKREYALLISGKTNYFHAQYRVQDTAGKYYWEEGYGTVAERDDNGNPTVVVGTTMCIDKQKRLERDLVNAKKHAEESDRMKSAFINNISHEVRTPLNAIIGFTDILTSITDAEERSQLVSIVKENNAKLLHIFEDMMNMAKLEATDDTMNLNIEKFDAVALVEETVAKARTNNHNPLLAIDFLSDEQKMEVNSDKGRLEYIVNHLLENAQKFTKEGDITAGLTTTPDGNLRLWVSDTGIGIDEEHQEKIFQRFYKVDDFVQGAGLGLSVCNSYAMSLGGLIDVESVPGKGSTFSVIIPVDLSRRGGNIERLKD